MIKPYLLLLSVVIFSSCAGEYIQTVQNNDLFNENEVSQESVVETSFNNSKLYQRFIDWRTPGPVIPGLRQVLVPQGMAYWYSDNSIIISNYMRDETAGALSIINMEDEKLDKVLFLHNDDKNPHTGHLGGIAVSRDHLWIASETGIYYILLAVLRETKDGETVYLSSLIETETKGSFATFSDDVLWIGEFTRKNGSYPSLKTHNIEARDNKSHRGWLGGYKLSIENDMIDTEKMTTSGLVPDYIISIPDEIQGAVFFEDKILLSASFGRKNYSRLKLFNSPIAGPPHIQQEFLPGRSIPLWFLDDNNQIKELIVPPMSEAVAVYKDNIAVLFESAASKYRDTASYPLDRIQFIDLDKFTR